MNKIILIFLYLIVFLNACNSQKITNESIQGNWALINPSPSSYSELYIDTLKIYRYDINFGYDVSVKYRIEENHLVILSYKPEFQNNGKIQLNRNNQLVIKEGNYKGTFKKINDTLPKLENLIKEQLTPDEYWSSFYKRISKD